MPTLEERRASAQRHVEYGRQMIERHKSLIEKLRAERRDTTAAQQLLAVFERTQKVFEYDLAELMRSGFSHEAWLAECPHE